MNHNLMRARLIEARELIGCNRKEFAERLNTSYRTITNYENGAREPKSDYLVKVAIICNVTTDWILGVSDEKKSPAPTVAGAGVPPTKEGLKVGLAYDQADDGIRASVRKLLDINPDSTDAEEVAFSLAACGGGLRQESLSKDQISLATKIAKETMAE